LVHQLIDHIFVFQLKMEKLDGVTDINSSETELLQLDADDLQNPFMESDIDPLLR